MTLRKPKPDKLVGCEYCKHKEGDFYKDIEDTDIIRVYCKARFDAVNAELMSKYCDFFNANPEEIAKTKEAKKHEMKGI